jgi:hypothetical protein
MTGRIKTLCFGGASGLIEAENGLKVAFDAAAVLAYDVAHLKVGQVVSFVMDGGLGRRAMNICVQKTPTIAPAEGPRKADVFRYMGFEQANAIRTYRFERTFVGEAAELFTVTTDLAMLAKYHVTIQEGPALCLRVLTVGIQVAGATQFKHALTEQDLVTHVESRTGPGGRHSKRAPRPIPAPTAI